MSAPLCDAVLGRDDSAQVLEQLERENLFVVALDRQRRWFRYHHLFREMLQAELALREPDLPSMLNRRAAAWCKANDQREVAMEYSAAARISRAEQSSGWASTLTAAELRLLPLLTTHLSFREIAERLFVSRNTVKTQAISVYRKLDASSRSEAIERAIELGLVDAPLASRSVEFTRSG